MAKQLEAENPSDVNVRSTKRKTIDRTLFMGRTMYQPKLYFSWFIYLASKRLTQWRVTSLFIVRFARQCL